MGKSSYSTSTGPSLAHWLKRHGTAGDLPLLPAQGEGQLPAVNAPLPLPLKPENSHWGGRLRTSSAWNGLLNTRRITEIPHYALGKKAAEDAYFTRHNIAQQCVTRLLAVCKQQKIHVPDYTFVEPSAGDGCFYDCLPDGADKIGIDINPKRTGFEKADYLTWWPNATNKKFIVVGNPPFGHRGAMALAFVNRSLLFADIVAFILPMSFFSNGKGTNMKRVNGATLLHSEKLPRDSFYDPATNKPVTVNTVFQVWMKGRHKSVFQDYDVSEYVDIYTCCSAPARYCGLGRGRVYDCYIAATFYGEKIGIVPSFAEVKYGSGYGLVVKKDKQRVMQVLQAADWGKHSTDATNSCKHIRMFHIRQVLGQAGLGTAV